MSSSSGSTKPTAVVRPPALEEAVELTQIAMTSKAHWGYDAAFMQACAAELTVTPTTLTNPNRIYRVAEIGDCLQGFFCLERTSRDCFELEALFVLPDVMRKGLGGLLMEHACVCARDAGANKLLIQSDPNAGAFYEGAGAKLVGQQPSLSIPGRNLPLYELSLDQRGI